MQLMNCFAEKLTPVYLPIKSEKFNSNTDVKFASVIDIYGVLQHFILSKADLQVHTNSENHHENEFACCSNLEGTFK